MTMTVPDEAVEAAATWLHDQDCPSALHAGRPADFPCYAWMEEAKELLEILAPFVAAQAWDEGRQDGHLEAQSGYENAMNPYRSEQ